MTQSDARSTRHALHARVAKRRTRAALLFPRLAAAPAALWAALCSDFAAAQNEPPRSLPPVVVSASALPQTEAAVSQHVSVYTRAQLDREAPASVADFLSRRAVGVLDRSPRSGGYGAFFLRGADPSHVVVLIDGIRQNDPLSSRGSAVDLNTLTLDDVERIEVVRGNASVAHREALAGVIQIFTRAPRDASRATAGVEAGGDGLRAANASLAHGPLRLGLVQREDGEADESGETRVRAANIGFREQYGATRLNGQLRIADSRNIAFPDDSGAAFAVNRARERRESDARQLALTADHDFGTPGALELSVARFERDSLQDTPSVAPGLRDPFGLPAAIADGRYRRSDIQANWRRALRSGWELLLGAAHQDETGSLASRIFLGAPVPANFAIHRITNSVAAEARAASGPWSVHAGLRIDRSSGYGSMRHPALSAQYRLAEGGGRIGFALSSAEKLPSFYALGHPLVGNPGLRPERSRQAEVYVANADSSPWKTRVTLFHARYRDLVDFDPGPPPRLVNRAAIHGTGVELGMRGEWRPGVHAYAQGTLMRVRDPEGGPPLRHRARRQASVGLDAQVAPRWQLHAGISYIGRRFDSSIPTGGVWLGGHAEANLSATWRGDGWQAFAALDNALDHSADETIGTETGARRLRVGLRWSL